MASIQQLLHAIQTSDTTDVPWWSRGNWARYLFNSVPDWEDLVRDPNNWEAIEGIEAPKGHDDLCELLVQVAGVDLAVRWLRAQESHNPRMEDQAHAARWWFRDVDNLTPSAWNRTPEEIKEWVIQEYFDNHPGEPFTTWREIARAIEHAEHAAHRRSGLAGVPPHPVIGYVPSARIRKLRSIVEAAGDSRSLALIDEMIAEREKACELGVLQKVTGRLTPYTASRDERELIAQAIHKALRSGFRPAPLPGIFLSFDVPPLFVGYPELEDEDEDEEEQVTETEVRRNRERGKPQTICIEDVLGCYVPGPEPRIILYARGLRWYAKAKTFDEEMLRGVVLVHEIGHWMTHLLPKPGCPEWPLELYKLAEEGVHEGWAQLITWWVAEDVGGSFKETFEDLNRSQPAAYRVFEEFRGKSVNSIMMSLERLRMLRWPARIHDWEGLT